MDFVAVGIEPLADVFDFYTREPSFIVVDQEIETLVPRDSPTADRGRGLLFAVERRVVVGVEIGIMTEIVKLAFFERAENGDFETLTDKI